MKYSQWVANQAKSKDKLSALRSTYDEKIKEAEDEAVVAVKSQLRNLHTKITRRKTDVKGQKNKGAQNARELACIESLRD